jgi:hypothetical protein
MLSDVHVQILVCKLFKKDYASSDIMDHLHRQTHKLFLPQNMPAQTAPLLTLEDEITEDAIACKQESSDGAAV